jgi:hypothetical protein
MSASHRRTPTVPRWLGLVAWAPLLAQASLLSGEAMDTMANVISWVVIIVAPVLLISVFWLLHILPEKVAEKRHHPQLDAIKTLCFLSLVFGGLLWPLAWIWAFTKPTLYKMAYGVDRVEPAHGPALAERPASEAAPVERGESH